VTDSLTNFWLGNVHEHRIHHGLILANEIHENHIRSMFHETSPNYSVVITEEHTQI